MSFKPERSDEHVTRLALKAGRGDKSALSEFIELTQETYLRMISASPVSARSSAKPWLLSLARRVWVDNIRHDMARPRKSAVDIEDATAGAAPSSWAEWGDARMLIDGLAPDRRAALILTQVLGYTYEEAAHIAGVRASTFRSRVARARADMIAASSAGQAVRQA